MKINIIASLILGSVAISCTKTNSESSGIAEAPSAVTSLKAANGITLLPFTEGDFSESSQLPELVECRAEVLKEVIAYAREKHPGDFGSTVSDEAVSKEIRLLKDLYDTTAVSSNFQDKFRGFNTILMTDDGDDAYLLLAMPTKEGCKDIRVSKQSYSDED
jgi:hypothetical protein